MPKTKTDPESLVPLRPVIFEILLMLNEAPRHGYGIMKEVAKGSGGRTILGPGTLYRTLKEMRNLDLVQPASGSPGRGTDERRHYYEITPFGKRVAAIEATRMATLVGIARSGNLISGIKEP